MLWKTLLKVEISNKITVNKYVDKLKNNQHPKILFVNNLLINKFLTTFSHMYVDILYVGSVRRKRIFFYELLFFQTRILKKLFNYLNF